MFLYYPSLKHVVYGVPRTHRIHGRVHVCARVSSCICTRTRESECIVHAAATARTALLLSLSLPPPSVSVARSGSVFMRVSMGKGSATRTRRKIISDLPRARRSCRPPYIARRSVLCAAFSKWKPTPLS